ncbi:hypothetical protein BGZ99_009900, partial [Dissophora globulifera]
MAHQTECRLTVPSVELPAVGAQFIKHNFLGHVCRLLQERQLDLRRPVANEDDNPLIAAILPPKIYCTIASQLYKDHVARVSDVSTADGSSLDSWSNLRQRLNITGVPRRWYRELQSHICESNTSNNGADDILPLQAPEDNTNNSSQTEGDNNNKGQDDNSD